ncbi:hypothetical protein [Nocardioides nitrophenolicus]|uniref:hypothetical protein n=1 Tax=Nocardioides nitrophenolicus TaxID=60489 RepID=UPI0019597194|nr:hypothetical protein [Nocardioides nitrophenolicus]MBM7518281.1 hypothetical protein [Nocardioides nitrophenolicus]
MRTLRSAEQFYRRSAAIARKAVLEARPVRRRDAGAVATVLATHQMAEVDLARRGIVAMLDEQRINAEAEALLSSAAFVTQVADIERMLDQVVTDWQFDRLIGSLTQGAGRDAMALEVAARPNIAWVRHVNPPCCRDCAILAGRVYRWSDGFERHPGCDCTHIPTTVSAANGLTIDPDELVDQGLVTGLSKADLELLAEGADLNQVVNVRKLEARMTDGRAVLVRRGRLTPAGILNAAGEDRDRIPELIETNGYGRRTRSAAPAPAGGSGPQDPPRPPTRPGVAMPDEPDPNDREAHRAYWQARRDQLEGPAFTAAGEPLDSDEVRFAERMVGAGHRLSWIPTGSNGTDEIGTLPANDFTWHTSHDHDATLPADLQVEHKGLRADTPVDFKHIARQIRNAMNKNKRRLIVTNVVVDVGDRDVSPEIIAELIAYYSAPPRPFERIWLMSHGELIAIVEK